MSKRSKKLEGKVGAFLKQYQRKAHAGHDPNDRHYDRAIEEKLKHMSPEQLSELMSGEGVVTSEIEEKWLRGDAIANVKHLANAPVRIVKGQYRDQVGTVKSLIDLHPEPKYLVELTGGETIVVFESQTVGL